MEQLNRRFNGTKQRLLWTDSSLLCEVDARRLDRPQIEAALTSLTDAGCMPPARLIDDNGNRTVSWDGVGAITYYWEWPAEGWRAAGALALRTLAVLKRHNLTVSQMQPYDIFMVGARPMFANMSIVAPWSELREATTFDSIQRYYLRPLRCAVHGRARLARTLLRSDPDGLTRQDTEDIVGEPSIETSALDNLLAWTDEVTLPDDKANKAWQAYEEDVDRDFPEDAVVKRAVLQSTLARLAPRSLLDLGCNTGRFALLAAATCPAVTGVDSDETCLNLLFRRAAASDRRVSSVVMDVREPSATRGWGDGWCASAEERLSSDCVVTMALMHHVILLMRMPEPQVQHLFRRLTRRWLLLEFVPIDKSGTYGTSTGRTHTWGADFYSFEWVMNLLGPHFIKRECWHYGKRGRFLALFERA